MTLSPYLHFRGDCEAALRFYAEVFGDPAPVFMRYSEAPDAKPGWGEDRIMYGHVCVAGSNLMASDFPPGEVGDAQAAVSVSASFADPAEAEASFRRLCEGGTAIMNWGATFFAAAGFGMVKDRFGTHWMIMVDAPSP